MGTQSRLSRRHLIGTAAAGAAALAIVPRHVLGGPKLVAPGERINVAYVGCGTQGLRLLMQALEKPELRITAVCDPNRRSDDYPEWSHGELNGKVRKFLNDPTWAANARGGLCGREVGRELVNRHYAKSATGAAVNECRAYADFRELLDKEKDIDAVYVMTPDHLHGTVAIHAMRLGKHVIVHKPLANTAAESRLVRDEGKRAGVATHMYCAADKASTATIAEWLAAGVIGAVREVHNWSTRPYWPQGMTEPPTDTPPVPEGFDWDLWLGPATDRPYHPAYTHAAFRGWFDFGSGALGDMGHYSFYQIFRILKLGAPASVEAGRSQFWSLKGYHWNKEVNQVSYPEASTIRWEFPARGELPPVTLHWYDGGLRPPTPRELERDGGQLPAEGMLFVGDDGKILCGFMGDSPRLIPQSRMKEFRKLPQTLPRPVPELDQWIRAVKGGQSSDANFVDVHPMAETIQLGNVALRSEKRLLWDPEAVAFTNAPEAQKWLRRNYRKGWEL